MQTFKHGDLIQVDDYTVSPVVRLSDRGIWYRTTDGTLDWCSFQEARPASDAQTAEYQRAQLVAGQLVARSAAMLRKNRPGWALKVDLDDLDMSSPLSCVLGHVEGSYPAGMRALFGDGYSRKTGERWGFTESATYYFGRPVEVTYGHLQQAWEEEIARELEEL